MGQCLSSSDSKHDRVKDHMGERQQRADRQGHRNIPQAHRQHYSAVPYDQENNQNAGGQSSARPPPSRPPRRPYVSTEDLVEMLDTRFQDWKQFITDVKKSKQYDEKTRRRIDSMMEETERELNYYNCNTKKDNPNGEKLSKMKQKEAEIKTLREKLDVLHTENNRTIEKLRYDLHESEKRVRKEKDENAKLILRLSKIAGDKLVANNPAIADLSDPNRPTKLGEIYSELYDNEWSDAFEGLQKSGYGDTEAINILRLTLIDTVEFCKGKSMLLLSNSQEVIDKLFDDKVKTRMLQGEANANNRGMTVGHQMGQRVVTEIENTYLDEMQRRAKIYSKWKPKTNKTTAENKDQSENKIVEETKKGKTRLDMEGKFKKLRKDVALSLVSLVQKAYIKLSWDDECIPSLKPYIRKCIFVGWLMMVQTPAMSLVPSDIKEGDKQGFNKDLYRSYTTTGPLIKYIVWPTMLLHDRGAVVMKGVAQGQK